MCRSLTAELIKSRDSPKKRVRVRLKMQRGNSNISLQSKGTAVNRRARSVKELLHQYDTNGSGRLGRTEVRNMLIDLSEGAFVEVTDDELSYVFKIADTN